MKYEEVNFLPLILFGSLTGESFLSPLMVLSKPQVGQTKIQAAASRTVGGGKRLFAEGTIADLLEQACDSLA